MLYSTQSRDHIGDCQLNLIHINDVKDLLTIVRNSVIDECIENVEIDGPTHDGDGRTLVSIDKSSLVKLKENERRPIY